MRYFYHWTYFNGHNNNFFFFTLDTQWTLTDQTLDDDIDDTHKDGYEAGTTPTLLSTPWIGSTSRTSRTHIMTVLQPVFLSTSQGLFT